MSIIELAGLAVALSMDAFAASVCKGLSEKKFDIKKALTVGGFFGFFQALMPLLGYFLGSSVIEYIASIDHWLVFGLLSYIGVNMIIGAAKDNDESIDASVDFKGMIVLSFATSIDALAAGISLAFMKVNIYFSVLLIGIVTFLVCIAGVRIGNVFGAKYKKGAEIIGGIVLIFIGLKILVEHLISG